MRAESSGVRAWVMLAMVAAVTGCAGAEAREGVRPVTLGSDALYAQLEPLARAIGDRRMVLLGENGHGVGDFTSAKAQLVEWLHRELGFDVVVMESGFFECGNAWRRLDRLSAREALYDCLRYPFEQAEILPLFELIAERRGSERPLVLAGMDPQAQGFDSGERPEVMRDAVAPMDMGLAERVASMDTALFLVADSGGQGDGVYEWVRERGAAARAVYDSAAALTSGWERWAVRLAGGLLERLSARAEAEAAGAKEPPARYYELRDEWMARAVAALADSIAGKRKVVIWLHNDHARYGTFAAGPHRIRSVAGFLRDWYPNDTFTIGFFMSRGAIADNGRSERAMVEPDRSGIEAFLAASNYDAGYVVLRGGRDAAVRAWADTARPYLRMGLDPDTLVPAMEFDALFHIDSVAPPTYRIR